MGINIYTLKYALLFDWSALCLCLVIINIWWNFVDSMSELPVGQFKIKIVQSDMGYYWFGIVSVLEF